MDTPDRVIAMTLPAGGAVSHGSTVGSDDQLVSAPAKSQSNASCEIGDMVNEPPHYTRGDEPEHQPGPGPCSACGLSRGATVNFPGCYPGGQGIAHDMRELVGPPASWEEQGQPLPPDDTRWSRLAVRAANLGSTWDEQRRFGIALLTHMCEVEREIQRREG